MNFARGNGNLSDLNKYGNNININYNNNRDYDYEDENEDEDFNEEEI